MDIPPKERYAKYFIRSIAKTREILGRGIPLTILSSTQDYKNIDKFV